MKGLGKVQRGIARAFRVGEELTTRQLMTWCYPRHHWRSLRDRRNACRVIRRVADRMCERAGRRWPEGVIWRCKELMGKPDKSAQSG
jgi:hypothetical protein